MFWKDPSPLDLEIDRATRALKSHQFGSAEYKTLLVIIDELNKQKGKNASPPISRDTLAVIVGNLLGILMIIKHEHVNVVTSRAMGLLLKPKV
jgi:hypothetical protein